MGNKTTSQILFVGPQANSTQQALTKRQSVKYEVHILSGKSSGLKAAPKDGCALYLVDEEKVDTAEYELCHELRRFDACTPILVYCANVAQQKLRLVAQAGAQRCLSKPVDSYCLLSAAYWLSSGPTQRMQGA